MTGRVALISYDFSTAIAGGAIRAITFARGLAGRGWEVEVITASPPEEWPDLPGGVAVHHAPSAERSFGGGIRADGDSGALGGNPRWLSTISALKALVPLERQLVWWRPFARVAAHVQADAVVTITAPYAMMAFGRRFARERGIPHIIDLRDDWMDRFAIERRTASNRALMNRFCEWHLRRSQAVLVVSPVTQRRLATLGLSAELIPNGYVESDFAGIAMEAQPRTREGGVRMVHLGWLGGFRTAVPVLEAAHGLDLKLHQYGLVEEAERAELQERGAIIHGQVPHQTAIRTMTEADVLLAIPGHQIPAAVSGKLYEYLRSRSPVLLVAPDGAARDLGARVGLRWMVDPADGVGMRHALQEIARAKREGTLRTQARPEAIRELERARGVEALDAVLDRLVRPEAVQA